MSMGRRRKAKRPTKLVRTDVTNVNNDQVEVGKSSENKENLVDAKKPNVENENANNNMSIGNTIRENDNVLGNVVSQQQVEVKSINSKKQPQKRVNSLVQSEFIFQSPTKRTTVSGSTFRRRTPTYHSYRTRKVAAKQTSIKLAVALNKLKAFNLYKIQRGKKIIDYITNRDSNESDSKSSASEPASPMAVAVTSQTDAAIDRHYSFTKIRHIPVADACKQSQVAAFPSNQSISTILSSMCDKTIDKKSPLQTIKIKDVVTETNNVTTIPTSGKKASTINSEPLDRISTTNTEKQSKSALRKYMYTKIKDIPVEMSKPVAKAKIANSGSQTTLNKIPPLETSQKKVTKHESTARAYAYKIKDYINTTQSPTTATATTAQTSASLSTNNEPTVASVPASITTNTTTSQAQIEHRSQHLKLNQIIAGVTATSDITNKRSFKIKDHFETPSTVTATSSLQSAQSSTTSNMVGQYQPMLLVQKQFDLINYNSKQIVQ